MGNAISCEYLMENMIITIESFLGVKPAAGNYSGRIIDGQMQMPDLSWNPFMGSRIHLLQFAEISSSWAVGMCIFDIHKIGLNTVGIFLCLDSLFIGF